MVKTTKQVTHLQRNGMREFAACGERVPDASRTWNLRDVTCFKCSETEQFTDARAYGDLGSFGREI